MHNLDAENLDAGFEEAYQNSLPVFKKYDKIRWIVLGVVILLEAGLAYLFYYLCVELDFSKARDFKYLIFVLLGMLGVWYFAKKNLEFFLKDNVMHDFLKNFGDLDWTLDDVIPKEEIKNALIFPSFNPLEFSTDDNFGGFYNKTAVLISEVSLKKGQGMYTVPVFKGPVVKIKTSKNFQGRVLVVEKDFVPGGKLEPVVLEGSEWVSKFKVYADDQIEARFVLTVGLMERILKLKEFYNAKRVALSFTDDCLIVGLDVGKDLFETCSLQKPVPSKKVWRTMYYQIYYILKLVDFLN